MTLPTLFIRIAASLVLACTLLPAQAADFPAPKEATWVARDFKFHTGEVMPELKLHYTTVGAPTGEPVWNLKSRATQVACCGAGKSAACAGSSVHASTRLAAMRIKRVGKVMQVS